ncbi:hypothetical protein ACWEVD_29195 [Nocardia thailandica]
MTFARLLTALAGAALATALSAGPAAAEPVTVPFQINPAPFGNPGGSFDVPPARCVVVLGTEPGAAIVTGGLDRGWGCLLSSGIRWLNLSSGATGWAQLSNGLDGIPPAATLRTGPGQVVLQLDPISGGTTTPGFAAFVVP